MGYSEDPRMVRVDFFKPSGKWYTTKDVKWTGSWEKSLVEEEFAVSLLAHLKTEASEELRLRDMVAVCLEPYHTHEYPVSVKIVDITTTVDNRDDRHTRLAEDSYQEKLAEEGYREAVKASEL